MLPVQLGVGLATSVGAIVLGAWMMGVEYGSRTIRRALSADPGRITLLLAKLGVVLGAVTVVTMVVSLASAPLFSAIASAHDESMPIADSLQYGLAALANNLIYATVAFALALMTRSMAGGMALALVFAFVIDSLLSAIPVVGDYALSAARARAHAGHLGLRARHRRQQAGDPAGARGHRRLARRGGRRQHGALHPHGRRLTRREGSLDRLTGPAGSPAEPLRATNRCACGAIGIVCDSLPLGGGTKAS